MYSQAFTLFSRKPKNPHADAVNTAAQTAKQLATSLQSFSTKIQAFVDKGGSTSSTDDDTSLVALYVLRTLTKELVFIFNYLSSNLGALAKAAIDGDKFAADLEKKDNEKTQAKKDAADEKKNKSMKSLYSPEIMVMNVLLKLMFNVALQTLAVYSVPTQFQKDLRAWVKKIQPQADKTGHLIGELQDHLTNLAGDDNPPSTESVLTDLTCFIEIINLIFPVLTKEGGLMPQATVTKFRRRLTVGGPQQSSRGNSGSGSGEDEEGGGGEAADNDEDTEAGGDGEDSGEEESHDNDEEKDANDDDDEGADDDDEKRPPVRQRKTPPKKQPIRKRT
ncbi:MAG: hypothetical protein LBG20_03335 [Holosporaceae bacterium]|jgi:hypothetical protein|nr:hypothetical protein [Holosporaceae bacterium]